MAQLQRSRHPGAGNPLDRRGRPLHDLRISVMDRCNFRCPYCMPKETIPRALPIFEIAGAPLVRRDRAVRAAVRQPRVCASFASPAASRCCART